MNEDITNNTYPLFLIDDKRINKISGPVLCYYLTPDDSIYEKYRKRNIFLPLLLLFGDVHGSIRGMCKPCDQSQDCYKIYDKELLSLLDKLSTDEHPVDFYIETFMDDSYNYIRQFVSPYSKEEIIQKYPTPLNKLIYGDIEICFKRTQRETVEYEEKCPTKNIRWHYSDPRENYKFFEGNLSLLLDYMEKIEKGNNNPEYLENIKFINQIKEVLLKLSTNNDKKINISNFSNEILSNPNITRISIINKQISKQSYYLNNLWNKALIYLIESRLHSYYMYLKLNIDENIYEDNLDIINFSDLVYNMDNSEYIYQYKNQNEQSFLKFKFLLEMINTSLLDLYFVTRMLKGYGNNQASLVVSYFGVNHIIFIKKLLERLFNYKTELEVGDDTLLHFNQPNRCLYFIGGIHETIDLTKDVSEHNIKRSRKCYECNLMFKPKNII
jgi:hypothetical protein